MNDFFWTGSRQLLRRGQTHQRIGSQTPCSARFRCQECVDDPLTVSLTSC